jgi:dihydrodipicolinate reductase
MHLPSTPDDPAPFMFVIDEVEPLDVDFTDPKYTAAFAHMKDATGARFVLATTATLDVA